MVSSPVLAKTPSATSSTVVKKTTPVKAGAKGAEPEEKGPDVAPFESEEDIEYIAASPENMLGFMRPDSFVGVVNRPYAEKPFLRQAEVFEITNLKNLTLDHKNCDNVVGKIVGPLDQISLKHEKTQLFKGKAGSACEVALMDPDAGALMPDRHLFVFNAKKAIYVLQFKFRGNAKASKSDVEDMRTFIKGLR